MPSLKSSITDLHAGVERKKRQYRDAASNRLMAVLTASFPVDLEPKLCELSSRLVAGTPTDADLHLMAGMQAADLDVVGMTREMFVVTLATVMSAY